MRDDFNKVFAEIKNAGFILTDQQSKLCNPDPENIDRITTGTVDKFIRKAERLRRERFPDKELRLGFFSKHRFENKIKSYLGEKGIVTEV